MSCHRHRRHRPDPVSGGIVVRQRLNYVFLLTRQVHWSCHALKIGGFHTLRHQSKTREDREFNNGCALRAYL